MPVSGKGGVRPDKKDWAPLKIPLQLESPTNLMSEVTNPRVRNE